MVVRLFIVLLEVKRKRMKNLLYILLFLLISQCKPKEDTAITQFPGKPEVPSSIKETHASLLEQVHNLTLHKDKSTQIALTLETLMLHHFKEEENFILPPLGLLPLLAKGELPKESKEIILLCEKMKSQMDHMSVEHQMIKVHIDELKQASKKENLAEIIEFEKEVIKHAISEEEIFFPTAILIGEYLKLKTAKKP